MNMLKLPAAIVVLVTLCPIGPIRDIFARGAVPAAGVSNDWLTLDLRDDAKWRWVGPKWHESDGVIRPDLPHVEDHLAFYVAKSYSDVEAEFEYKLNDVFGSTGFILRVQDATHYYLVSFPTIGQQARAKHFWACISRADGDGWLKVLRMQIVGGIPSERSIDHKVRVVARGDEITVWVDGRRGPSVRDDTYASGHVGLESWATYAYGALFSNVRVRGVENDARPWDETVEPPQNWFTPFATEQKGQAVTGLVRAPGGDLVMALPPIGLVHSADNGRTWSKLDSKGWSGGFLIGPRDGKLLTFVGSKPDNFRAQSADGGRTWSKYEPIELPPLMCPEDRVRWILKTLTEKTRPWHPTAYVVMNPLAAAYPPPIASLNLPV